MFAMGKGIGEWPGSVITDFGAGKAHSDASQGQSQPLAVRTDTAACVGLQLCKHPKVLELPSRSCVFTPFPYSPATACGPCDKQIEELNWIQTSCFCTELVLAGVSCCRRSLVPVGRREGRACGATASTALCTGGFWASSGTAVSAILPPGACLGIAPLRKFSGRAVLPVSFSCQTDLKEL